MTEPTSTPSPLLSAQRAQLVAAPAEGCARWELEAAGPAALQAAKRDLALLASLPEGHRLRVDAVAARPDGGLDVVVPWSAGDLGLDQLLRDAGPLPLPRVLALARGLSASLASLHQQGLVHGGLHPRLVRVPPARAATDEPSPDPYVIGAGWAPLRVAWNQRGERDPDILRYLAPEMLRGQASKLDRQADLFGLGCLVFEALTGRAVFPGADPDEVRQAILRPERPDLLQDLGPAEESLARVLRRCLAAEPADRFPSATALWRELAPALGGQATPLPALHDPGGRSALATLGATGPAPAVAAGPAAASPAPAIRPGTRPLRASPALFTAGVFVTAAIVALGVLWATRRPAPRQPPEDALSRELFAGSRSPDAARPLTDAVATDPEAGPSSLHAVPAAVPVDPRTTRLRDTLARAGLTEEESIVSELLHQHVKRAVRALGARDYRQFDEAMHPVELATRPRECPSLLRLKRGYILGGIRSLGPRLGQWERFRIERMLADADSIPGACPKRNALLRPLVLEVRDRLRHARAQAK